MGRSRVAWVGSTVAPWGIALGFLVSITAQAGQELGVEARPAALRALNVSFVSPTLPDAKPILEARLVLGSRDDLSVPSDEIDPNPVLKQGRSAFPTVVRDDKGDPFIIFRPSFQARRASPSIAKSDARDWPDDSRSPALAAAADAPDPGAPLPFGDGATPGPSLDFALNSATPTPSDGKLVVAVQKSPSPVAPAAVAPAAAPPAPPATALQAAPAPVPQTTTALASKTAPTLASQTPASAAKTAPAPAQQAMAAAAQTTIAPQTAAAPSPLAANGKPDYSALIDPKDSARQMRCLAEAIYFEARSEPEDGQAGVAQVVLNRVRSGIFPSNVCAVVYQDHNHPFACQFSFACEGKSLRIEEPAAWATATRVAQSVVAGATFNPLLGEALNYHAYYVYPFWAPSLRRVDRIGAHIFYAMRSGLTWTPGAVAIPVDPTALAPQATFAPGVETTAMAPPTGAANPVAANW
ncbi:MAG: cell wall hydrolase [Bradyrhizobium sp.]|nr:MAG: cell wall hydrolase [Bradyrhizobium sp.]